MLQSPHLVIAPGQKKKYRQILKFEDIAWHVDLQLRLDSLAKRYDLICSEGEKRCFEGFVSFRYQPLNPILTRVSLFGILVTVRQENSGRFSETKRAQSTLTLAVYKLYCLVFSFGTNPYLIILRSNPKQFRSSIQFGPLVYRRQPCRIVWRSVRMLSVGTRSVTGFPNRGKIFQGPNRLKHSNTLFFLR